MNQKLNKIEKIVILTLDGFAPSKGLKKIFDEFHEKIVLVCESQRFGGKYGSFSKQFIRNLNKSGWEFVIYQSLNLIWHKIIVFITDILNYLFGKSKKLYTLSQLVKRHDIELVKAKDINHPEIISLIKSKNPDLIISFYFDQVIKKEIIAIPKIDTINIHTAKLPQSRGPFPVLSSFIKEVEGSITIHSIHNEELDVGPIYKQEEYKLEAEKSILFHDHESLAIGADMIINLINEINKDIIISKKQQEIAKGFYMSFPDKKDIKLLKKQGIKLFSIKEFLKSF